jgi:hypothetical protein
MSPKARHRSPGNPAWLRPGIVALVAVLIALGVAIAATKLFAHAAPPAPAASPTSPTPAASAARSSCADLVVPAYFAANYWAQASGTRPPPADMILDPATGLGAGTTPDPGFQTLVRQAKSAGITILGYSSTADGARPAGDVEADARHYRDWYGVTHVFLDRVSGDPAQSGYYQGLAGYIHQLDGPGSVWLNPGVYPDQGYMAIGDVVMVFEGTYPQYQALQVPGWAASYPASKFAHTVYATPAADLASALGLAASRHALHVYVTDGTGGNPYAALPGYWSREAAGGCGGA